MGGGPKIEFGNHNMYSYKIMTPKALKHIDYIFAANLQDSFSDILGEEVSHINHKFVVLPITYFIRRNI